jgi:DNA-binding FadR family transcriptional regulator
MNSGATADRVYDALKRRLLSGALVPGQKLEPAPLAEDLISSVTPVRDALNRLIGERIVETRAGSGYHLALVHEPDLRDLYAWNTQLLIDAIRWWPSGQASAAAASGEQVAATRDLFDGFATRTGNAELVAAIGSANDRLNAARVAEAMVLDETGSELEAIASAIRQNSRAEIGRLIRIYHRRRLFAVPTIVRSLYRPRSDANNRDIDAL